MKLEQHRPGDVLNTPITEYSYTRYDCDVLNTRWKWSWEILFKENLDTLKYITSKNIICQTKCFLKQGTEDENV